MSVDQLFHALGEPTRLKIVRRLSSGNTFTITSISQGLSISRQGARKHLRILSAANVISLKQNGRSTGVVLNRATLERAKAFITGLEQEWDARLMALKKFVDSE